MTELMDVLHKADVVEDVIVSELRSALANTRREIQNYRNERKGHGSDFAYNLALEHSLQQVINHYRVGATSINEYVDT